MTKTDKSWKKLFDEYDIINEINKHGKYVISSKQINKYREARLMTKFDHKANLPILFQDNNLSILPLTRGTYIISQFDAYKSLSNNTSMPVTEVQLPCGIESIDSSNIYSEAAALNCAYSSGMINDFLEEDYVLPTVSGRMSSQAFNFNIRNIQTNNQVPVSVANSQIEIDGGYEGINKLMLIEAKNSISSDFLIRQLYYPYRLWDSKINKEIVPVFMIYSNDIFSFYEFKFVDPENYNSLILIKQKNYIIAPEEISLQDIYNILNRVKIINEPTISFPQADSFERVINLLEMLMEKDLDKDYLTHTLDIHHRQTNYYTSALRYLGLINKIKDSKPATYYINKEGRRIMELPYKQKYLSIVEKILQNPSFNEALRLYLNRAEAPDSRSIVQIMKRANVYKVGKDSTFERRATTVRSWLKWILNLVQDY